MRPLPAASITIGVDRFAQGILHVCQHVLIQVAQEREVENPLSMGMAYVFNLTISTVSVTHISSGWDSYNVAVTSERKKLGARRKGILTIRGWLEASRAHGGEGIVGPLLHISLLRWAFQGLSS